MKSTKWCAKRKRRHCSSSNTNNAVRKTRHAAERNRLPARKTGKPAEKPRGSGRKRRKPQRLNKRGNEKPPKMKRPSEPDCGVRNKPSNVC